MRHHSTHHARHHRHRLVILVAALLAITGVFAACQPPPPAVPIVDENSHYKVTYKASINPLGNPQLTIAVKSKVTGYSSDALLDVSGFPNRTLDVPASPAPANTELYMNAGAATDLDVLVGPDDPTVGNTYRFLETVAYTGSC